MIPNSLKSLILFFVFCLLTPAAIAAEVKTYFSPSGGASAAVVDCIDNAKTEVLVAAYSINNEDIIDALSRAHARGLTVSVIVDRGQESQPSSKAYKISRAKIETLTDGTHQLQHNKYVVVDRSIVCTGSMNFTLSGETRNAENVVVISDVASAKAFADDWTKHKEHSRPFFDSRPRKTPRASPLDPRSKPKRRSHEKGFF